MKSFQEYLGERAWKQISKKELDQVEKTLDQLFAGLGVDVEFTKHFFERLNHKRNKKPISPQELVAVYQQVYAKFGKKISKTGAEEVDRIIKSVSTALNIPVALKYNRNTKEVEMVAKTIMRKKGFKHDKEQKPLQVESTEEG